MMNVVKKITKTVVAMMCAAAVFVSTAVPTFAAAKHTVTFLYGTKSYQVVVDDGCTALPPTDTYVPGYIFAGWVGNATNVKSDITILGAYTKIVDPQPAPQSQPAPSSSNTYTVRFVDTITGAEYYRQTVSEGADANPPDVPHHDGYHYEGYDGDFTHVTSDRTIYVRYGWDFGDWHDDPSEWWWIDYDYDRDGSTEDDAYWWLS